jgi:hypothetical protein
LPRRPGPHLADLPDRNRPAGLPHDGEDALVLRWQRRLLHVRLTVRDQQHRLTVYRYELQFSQGGGPAVTGEWSEESTADRNFRS